MLATRKQSYLGWGEMFGVIATWLVVGGGFLAIYTQSLPVTAGVLTICILVFLGQINIFFQRRVVPCDVTG